MGTKTLQINTLAHLAWQDNYQRRSENCLSLLSLCCCSCTCQCYLLFFVQASSILQLLLSPRWLLASQCFCQHDRGQHAAQQRNSGQSKSWTRTKTRYMAGRQTFSREVNLAPPYVQTPGDQKHMKKHQHDSNECSIYSFLLCLFPERFMENQFLNFSVFVCY